MIKEVRKFYLIILSASTVLMALLFTSCNNQKAAVKAHEPPVYLYKIKINNKWGFIDSTGNVKIKPQYNYAGDFSEGLAPVSIGGVETIDTINKIDGRLIGDYWNIVTIMKGEKWGYIDTSGEFVIKPSYDLGYEFCNGIAAVLIDKLYGYIDSSGSYTLPPQFSNAQPFYDDYAAVSYPSSDSTYFIDQTGKKMFVSTWDVAISFIDGLAPISIFNKNYASDSVYYKNGYIDNKGRCVVKPIYDMLNLFHNERALFGLKSGGAIKYGFIDQKGKIKISANYSFATDFGDSVAWVEKDSQLSIININGKILKSTKYKNAQRFSEGVSAVQQNGKWGYCDKEGNISIEPQFDEVEPFNNSLAWVKRGNVSGYINKSGKYVWSQAHK